MASAQRVGVTGGRPDGIGYHGFVDDTLLDKLAEGLRRLSDGSAEEAERLVADALRALPE